MHLLAAQARFTRQSHSSSPVSQAHQLSSTARYHIGRFLRQPSDYESAELLAFKIRLSADHCAHLDKILHKIYPDGAELERVLLRLDNLVYLYTTLSSPTIASSTSTLQLHSIKQEIFQLLGFKE
jgi:hypothetical protein